MTPEPLRHRVLLSYWHHRDRDLDDLFGNKLREPYPELFVDSGAFSAYTQGVEVDPQAYMAWVRRWSHWITTYASLDAIGDAAATLRNQHLMEDAGFRPLPVFHIGEDWSYLEDYLQGYQYIALGGLVPVSWSTALPWLRRCFRMARTDPATGKMGTAPRAVYHGFGVSSWQTLKALPFYSVDASTWAASFRYGRVSLFDEERGRWAGLRVGEKAEAEAAARFLALYDLIPEDVWDRERYFHLNLVPAVAMSWMRAERWLRRRHGVVTIPGSGNAGLRQYLEHGKTPEFYAVAAQEGLRQYLVYLSDLEQRGETVQAALRQGRGVRTMDDQPPGINSEIQHLAVPIHDVKPHPRNARRGDLAAITESLRANGQYKPIYANRGTTNVVAGNHTWRAMRDAGAAEIAVLWLRVDDDQELELALNDNATSDAATYDDARLAALLQRQADDYGLGGSGYTMDALDDVLAAAGMHAETAFQEFEGGVRGGSPGG